MQSKKKTIIWLLIVVSFIIIFLLGIRYLRINSTDEEQPSSEMLAEVQVGDIEVWVTGSGVIEPVEEEVVITKISGVLENYYIENNTEVSTGDVLATLKTEDQKLQIEKLKIDIENLEIALDKLEDENTKSYIHLPAEGSVVWLVWEGYIVRQGDVLARFKETSIEEGTSEQPIIDIIAEAGGTIIELRVVNEEIANEFQIIGVIDDLDRSVAIQQDIAEKELQIRQLSKNINDLLESQAESSENSIIKAPIDGNLLIPDNSMLSSGMSVTQGTILATIADYSKFEVIIPIDELDINKITVGQKAEVSVDALPDEIIYGEVIDVAERGQNIGGIAVYNVTVTINQSILLKAAMSASVSILTETRTNILVVPIEAVYEVDGESMVTIVELNQDTGSLETQTVKVETGIYNSSSIEILSGLEEGQQIAIQGIQNELESFRPGQGNRLQGSD